MSATDFVPTACWAWASTEPRREAYRRPSVDPEAARIEDTAGLTGEVLRRYLDRFTAIVGPLARRPDVFRPLSLRGGRLISCELLGVPDDSAWESWVADLEHVQTNDPAVCEALASSVPSFTVAGAACLEALRGSRARVVDAGPADRPGEPWIPAPFLDARAFLPIIEVTYHTWWCWDVDEERPVLLATGEEPSYFVGYEDSILTPSIDLLGPLPARRAHPPSAHLAHAAANGDGWAAALHAAGRMQPLVITAPRRVAVLLPIDANMGDHGDQLAWRFVHAPETVFENDPGNAVTGSLTTVELLGGRLRVRWAGEYRLFRLRGGELESLTEPHTLLREMIAQGLAPESMPEHLRNIATRGIGHAPEVLELAIEPGDRYLICARHTEERFDRGSLRRLLGDDPRRSATTVMHALSRARRTEAALFFTAEATFTESHPGWFPDLAIELANLEDDPSYSAPIRGTSAQEQKNPFDRPQRFGIYRAARAMSEPAIVASRMWERALSGALERFCAAGFAPRRFDLFRTWTARGGVLSMQFDGERWNQIRSSYRPQDGRVAEGRLCFREDRPTEALHALLERGKQAPLDAAELEELALREGFVELSLWLKLEREHIEGQPGLGLREARDRVSLRVRRNLRQLRFHAEPVAHAVDARRLLADPTFYDRCHLRYRSLVNEGFEAMWTAGAWWDPALDDGVDGRRFVADMDVVWRSDGFSGYGHMGMSDALASGTATPYVRPRAPRFMRAQDIDHDRLRAGVPVRAELEIDVGDRRWTWRRREVEPPADWAGLDRDARTRITVEAIVMGVEQLVILEVLRVSARRDAG